MRHFESIITFIREKFGNNQEFIPLHEPRFWGNEKAYLLECLDSTFVSSVGKFVDQFEEMVANYTGAKKAVVCVNGTNALHLALKLVGVESGDEVITQPLTFIATANAISYCGAHPIFLDVDRDTIGLSSSKLEEWLVMNAVLKQFNDGLYCVNISTGRRIKACIPMHTFGHACKIDEIIEICAKYNIRVVEDAAESLGSFYKGKHTGTFSEIGILSFNGNKTITTGGGGMLLFNDEKFGEYAKHLTTQAKIPHKWEFRHDYIGYNYRMPNINAALGCAQMEQINDFISRKRELANEYRQFFNNSEYTFIDEPKNSRSNFWLNAVIFKNRDERELFLEYTNSNGVMTRPIWDLMNTLPMFKSCQTGDISNSIWLADRIVNIPSSVI